MKARIITAQPLALLYRLEENTVLTMVLANLNIQVKTIAPHDLSQSVGFLAGMGGVQNAPFDGTVLETPLMLMANFSENLLDTTLAALREQGVKTGFKAVVTPHNQAWTVEALLAELQREKEEIEKGTAQ